MRSELEALWLSEDEEQVLEIEGLETGAEIENFELCVVGMLMMEKSFNFEVMKNQMAEMWRSCKGITIKDLGGKLIFFKFYHILDLRWVVDNGPRTHNGNVLVLDELERGEKPRMVPLGPAPQPLVRILC
ncbi:hypothetical protein LINPERHAP2_LOCUS18658 [Linum perenne]